MARNLDMFSLLPESLILVLLSFIPFKEAVRMSILSKKWSEIWKSSMNIEFNETFFVKPNEESDETKQAQRMVFINFITRFIANYTSNVVEKFSLKISNPQSCRETIDCCVDFASHRGVIKLELDFSNPKWEENNNFDEYGEAVLFQLPNHVYTLLGTSLESLKLYSCNYAMSDLLNFASLKDVSLGYVEVTITTLKNLLLSCKMIENLSLTKCWNLKNLYLGEKPFVRLRRLVIDRCYIDQDQYFRLIAPNLKFFKYIGNVPVWSEIQVNRDVMEEAHIDFYFEPQLDEYGDQICKLVGDFFPVRILTVCSFLLQTIASGEEQVHIQGDLNVRHLILKTQLHPNELCGFMFLLNSCPMLEKITIEISPRPIFPDYKPPYRIDLKNFWTERRVIPKCLRRTLKVVEINEFRGCLDEFIACCYFIHTVRVLEELKINLWKDDDDDNIEKRRKLAQHLITLPKASKNLQISIV